ncbi:MAG: preprotein translocase subunit SecG [Alphaproteobacteria bacterium]|nr:preprotein translocase subunit SecG [Alphaproteobacteria bacterium]
MDFGVLILIVHLLVCVALVGLVLLQPTEGNVLGVTGGQAGMSGLFSGRGQASGMTRTTAILAAMFFVTSIALTLYALNTRAPRSIIDNPAETGAPAVPSVPQSGTDDLRPLDLGPAQPSSGAPAAPAAPASAAPAPATTAPATDSPAPASEAPPSSSIVSPPSQAEDAADEPAPAEESKPAPAVVPTPKPSGPGGR